MKRILQSITLAILTVILSSCSTVDEESSEDIMNRMTSDLVKMKLKEVVNAGKCYMTDDGTTEAKYSDLKVYLLLKEPIDGESYNHIVVKSEGGILKVRRRGGEVVKLKY